MTIALICLLIAVLARGSRPRGGGCIINELQSVPNTTLYFGPQRPL